MAVYTKLSQLDIQNALSPFSLGKITGIQGISDGIENTNYFVHFKDASYVLTIFEQLTKDDLPFYLEALERLSSAGLVVPKQCFLNKWEYYPSIFFINNKAAILCGVLEGEKVQNPSTTHCHEIALFLAKMHSTEVDSSITTSNKKWWHTSLNNSAQLLNSDENKLASTTAKHFSDHYLDYSSLPSGFIHADLFHDNALFHQERLSGVVDFFNAKIGPYLYDLAVVVNDWCYCNNEFNKDNFDALIEAYQSIRPLTKEEKQHWPLVMQMAAFRFWLSRVIFKNKLTTNNKNIKTKQLNEKNPDVFKSLLITYLQEDKILRI